jgi:hypothetical protein
MGIKFRLLLFFVFLAQPLFSQIGSGKISGSFVDEKNKPIESVSIVLSSIKDENDKKTIFSDSNGKFEFNNLAISEYQISASYLGYITYKSDVLSINSQQTTIDLAEISLFIDKNILKEVSVTSSFSPIERKSDKTVVNVDALITNAGASVLDVLSNSPGVSVDQNGGISLQGKPGVIIFIDDKPTYLAGAELETYLRSMPSSNLKQIELMTNPPAKYDAAGNAGIINLRTKRSKLKGIHGNVTTNYAQGRYARSNNSLILNYNTKKINFFSNFSYGVQNSFQDLNINRIYKNPDLSVQSTFRQNSFIRQKGNSQEARLGFDYYATKKTTLGFNLKGFYNPNNANVDNKSIFFDSSDVLTSKVIADNNTKGLFKNGTISGNFRHEIDSLGRNITVDVDYLVYKNKATQLFKNTILDPTDAVTFQDELDGKIPLEIKIYALKSDYVHPLKNNASFSAGVKFSLTKTDNVAEYFTSVNNVTTPNYDISNAFLYDEIINATYATYEKNYKRLSMQYGLRVENTISKGNQLGNVVVPASRFNRNYTDFFPTVFLSYKLDSIAKNQLTLSYGKRIDRPFYKDLNPFISPLDKFTFYSGNPFLKPTYSNNFSIAHIYRNNLTTAINYSVIDDGINETLEIVNGIYYSRPGNISTNRIWTLSVNGTFPMKKWWSFTFYTEAGYQQFKSQLYNEQLDTDGTYCVIKGVNSFVINSSLAAEVTGEYTSNYTVAQLIAGDVGFVNFGLRKKILNEKGNLRCTLSDVFFTRKFRGVINNLTLTDADYNSRVDTRVISLTFNYQFGNSDNKKPKYNGTGSESEQKRVKV